RARPDEEDVSPGVHPHADRGPGAHAVAEWIEPVGGLSLRAPLRVRGPLPPGPLPPAAGRETLSSRLQSRRVIGIAAAADLDDDVVDAAGGRVGHEVIDRGLRGDLVADDPER